jgi:hypothetical protein
MIVGIGWGGVAGVSFFLSELAVIGIMLSSKELWVDEALGIAFLGF